MGIATKKVEEVVLAGTPGMRKRLRQLGGMKSEARNSTLRVWMPRRISRRAKSKTCLGTHSHGTSASCLFAMPLDKLEGPMAMVILGWLAASTL